MPKKDRTPKGSSSSSSTASSSSTTTTSVLSSNPYVAKGQQFYKLVENKVNHFIQSSDASSDRAVQFLTLALIGFAVLFILPTIYWGISQIFTLSYFTNYEQLSVKNVERIQQVLFGTEAWLILCRKPRDKFGVREQIVQKAGVYAKQLNEIDRFHVGFLNCHGVLFKTDTTVLEHFSLPSHTRAFVVAKSRATAVPKAYLKVVVAGTNENSNDSQDYYLDDREEDEEEEKQQAAAATRSNTAIAGERLGSWVVNATQIKPFVISTSMQLKAQCLRKKACLLVMHQQHWQSSWSGVIHQIQRKHIDLTVTTLNMTRWALSLEHVLPAPINDNQQDPRAILFVKPPKEETDSKKTGSKAAKPAATADGNAKNTKPAAAAAKAKPVETLAKAHRDAFDIHNLGSFIQDHIYSVDKKNTKLAALSRAPTVERRETYEKWLRARVEKQERDKAAEEAKKQGTADATGEAHVNTDDNKSSSQKQRRQRKTDPTVAHERDAADDDNDRADQEQQQDEEEVIDLDHADDTESHKEL